VPHEPVTYPGCASRPKPTRRGGAFSISPADPPTTTLLALGTALVALVALGLFILTWRGLPLDPIPRSQLFTATQCLGGLIWLGAVALVHRHRFPPRTLWFVLAAAAVMRVMTFVAPPLLSSDIYRYVWDGRVQRAGINPYRYLPDAPQLAFLRDQAVFPNINRAEYAPTIYPPTAEALFALAGRIAPGVYGMKAVMAAFDILAIVALLPLLTLAGRDRTQVLIYAWLPLPVWEFAGSGHIDAAATGLLALALLSAAYGGAARTGVALAAATLTKFLPGVVLPAFWRPWNWRMLAAFVATVGAFYAPYLGVGWRVFGFLGGYVREENLVHGGGIFLLEVLDRIVPLPSWATTIYAAIVLAVLAALAIRFVFVTRLPADPGARIVLQACQAAILGAVLLVALSPHYPWYFAWLAPLACLASLTSVYWLLIAAPLLSHDPVGYLSLAAIVYVPAAALAALDVRRAHRRSLACPPPR
jgi:alpha-1,6-mannosyltransferase